MAGYLGNIPTPQATQTRDTFTATSGQTSFATSGYTVGMLDVYLNGIKLASADFTASNGSDVVLASGASADDIVEVVSFSTFESDSGTFTGAVTVGGDLTVDTSTLKVDSSNNRIGIGVANPAEMLHIENTSSDPVLRITGPAAGSPMLEFRQATSQKAFIAFQDTNENLQLGSDGIVTLATNGTTERIRINSDGRTQITANKTNGFACELFNDGNNNDRYGLHLQCGTDDASGTNYAITFYDGDVTSQGNITFSSGTVSYGAFTAYHEISLPDADKANGYPYGTLLETTDIYYTQKDGSDTERGIRYVTQKSSSQYSRKVLGAYHGDMLAVADSSGTYANNLHQAAVLGDGHIICNNSGGNIKVGDGICASATAGIGQKADKLCMIIGIAQKDITFSGSETVLVPVQYGLQQFTPWTD